MSRLSVSVMLCMFMSRDVADAVLAGSINTRLCRSYTSVVRGYGKNENSILIIGFFDETNTGRFIII